ncbi:hypothetical protein TSAR_013490 [Trichomalopsis sarcophagae]|uniref:Uncharacterized protein n=1 Tax=Trichomalopsis sarcophagae TaxID=543379 RepID=A0A232FI91_9HYME|nr:hypothetical protein TSAR_013490 [Trichomalopsis sarcophagae]
MHRSSLCGFLLSASRLASVVVVVVVVAQETLTATATIELKTSISLTILDNELTLRPKRAILFATLHTNAAAAASYVTPYTYATLPGAAGLPSAATAGAAFPGLPYQTTPQEARLQ